MAVFDYQGWTLEDAIDALYAYDSGCVDSGVRDDLMKRAVAEHLRSLPDREMTLTLSRLARDAYLSEDALAKGYSIEDVKAFIDWLSWGLGIDY